MLPVERKLEVERILNLVASFDWKVVSQEDRDNTILITIAKTLSPAAITPPEVAK